MRLAFIAVEAENVHVPSSSSSSAAIADRRTVNRSTPSCSGTLDHSSIEGGDSSAITRKRRRSFESPSATSWRRRRRRSDFGSEFEDDDDGSCPDGLLRRRFEANDDGAARGLPPRQRSAARRAIVVVAPPHSAQEAADLNYRLYASDRRSLLTSGGGGRNFSNWPLIALWHSISLILFLLAIASSSSANAIEEMFTIDSSTPNPNPSATCHIYDYFVRASSSSTNTRTARSTSAFYASNPALDNVFAIWLRASRSSRTFEQDQYASSSSDVVFPVPLYGGHHRYQYYSEQTPPGNVLAAVSGGATTQEQLGRDEPSTEGSGEGAVLDDDDGLDDLMEPPWLIPVAPPQSPPTSNRGTLLQCELFDEARADELCSLDSWSRVAKLRQVYLRTDMVTNRTMTEMGNNSYYTNYNCSTKSPSSTTILLNHQPQPQPMTLYTYFQLDIRYDGALARSNPLKHLAPEFRPCVYSYDSRTIMANNYSSSSSSIFSSSRFNNSSSITSSSSSSASSCRTCYRNVLNRLKVVDSRQENFSISVLSMLDCEPDNDLEQFSPTTNCSECKVWYRRWLLVILTSVWKQKPCVEWCNLAELACPHLPPVKRNDYAGLPSFRCTDPEIGSSNINSSYGFPCDCMHPCDPQSPTIHWGWNVSAERPEFCRDYVKRDCRSSSSSASTSPSSASSSSNKPAPPARTKLNYYDPRRTTSTTSVSSTTIGRNGLDDPTASTFRHTTITTISTTLSSIFSSSTDHHESRTSTVSMSTSSENNRAATIRCDLPLWTRIILILGLVEIFRRRW